MITLSQSRLTMVISMLSMSLFFSCTSGTSTQTEQEKNETKTEIMPAESTAVQVLYLHGKSRCPSCLAIEEATKETIANLFTEDLENGNLLLSIIDIDLPENRHYAEKYEAFGPTLLICTPIGGEQTIKDLTGDGFRFAMRDKARFASLLRLNIEESLNR